VTQDLNLSLFSASFPWGLSQGGWLAPLVAERWPALAFVVLHAAPATSVYQQGIDNLEGELRAEGLEGADVEGARDVMRRSLDYDLDPSDARWEDYLDAHAAATARGLAWVPPIEPRDSGTERGTGSNRDFWSPTTCDIGFEPVPPFLSLFSTCDIGFEPVPLFLSSNALSAIEGSMGLRAHEPATARVLFRMLLVVSPQAKHLHDTLLLEDLIDESAPDVDPPLQSSCSGLALLATPASATPSACGNRHGAA